MATRGYRSLQGRLPACAGQCWVPFASQCVSRSAASSTSINILAPFSHSHPVHVLMSKEPCVVLESLKPHKETTSKEIGNEHC